MDFSGRCLGGNSFPGLRGRRGSSPLRRAGSILEKTALPVGKPGL